MITKTNAIVLRFRPYRATSRLITWLTPDHGKITTLAKGCQRPRSPLLGQFDSFYECQILYYDHPPSSLHLLKECSPINPHARFRHDFRSCTAASYAASLVDRALPYGPSPQNLYPLLRNTLADFSARTPGPATLLRFEASFLDILGFLPNWHASPLPHPPDHHATPPPAALAALDNFRQYPHSHTPHGLPKSAFRRLHSLLGALLENHADLSPIPRSIAYALLSHPSPLIPPPKIVNLPSP